MINSFLLYFIFIVFCPQKNNLDSRLFGQWTLLYTMDSQGEIIKDEFYGKNYIEEYTKDGRLILDPKFLLDDMKRRGETMTLDYASIPTFQWNSINNNTLRVNYGELGSKENRYGILGDTLLIGFPNGNVRYLLRRK
jgi:hypothetical protein